MKKVFLLSSLLVITCLILGSGAWAQEPKSNEFTLEEITVTAEKRSANVQKLPSSVVALTGSDLAGMGKITTAQVLESVPNVTFRDGGATNPDGNIAIRGIQRTQVAKGIDDVLPATTAVYVDGVYQGIGGHYDVNRVEVLRGPQGTLYGRSSTGGVVSFYTNDPKLGQFSGNVSAEYGNYSLVNAESSVNVPVGEKVALRAAAHYYSRDGYVDAKGGHTETKEGRLKVLFQPTDQFNIVVHGSMQETVDWAGGWSAALSRTDPDKIIYHNSYSNPAENPPKKYNQLGVNANYDFGKSTLTWVAGYHTYDFSGKGAESVQKTTTYTKGVRTDNQWPTDWYHTEEVRWASATEGPLSWLVGATYFKQEFENSRNDLQTWVTGDPQIPDGVKQDVTDRYRWATGSFLNYGIFTEETYKLRDDLHITAGLRYDKTDFKQSMIYEANQNLTALRNFLSPEKFAIGELLNDTHKWHNVTYKLRLDYDLTPANMVYLTTATGFVPGYAAIGPRMKSGVVTGWDIRILNEQKMTSYEIGTKNQFLNNTLRLNGSLFYYAMEGYPEVFELSEGPGPSIKQLMETPIKVFGLDMEVEYLPTMDDKVTLTAGYQRPELKGWPASITWPSGTVTSGKAAAILEIQPGHATFDATLGYDHTFSFNNGSALVPRAELRYTGGYYLTQMSYVMANNGGKLFDYQDANLLCNAGLNWISANQKYSVNAWVRNVLDKEYKASTSLQGIFDKGTNIGFTPGEPRTFGVGVNIKF